MNNFNGIEKFMQEDLEKSGLTVKDISVEPLLGESQLFDRLGFKFIEDKRITDIGGYWIKNNGHWRLKLKEKIGDIKYLSPKGSGNHAYIPPQVAEMAKNYNPDKPLFFTEGEKKAAKLTLEGFPCIGLIGVWNFTDSELNLTNRKCYIIFDSDLPDKFNVRHAELRLSVMITNHSGIPLAVRLPNEAGGEKNGADEYLVRYGKKKLQELVIKARPAIEAHIEEELPTETLLKETAKLNSDIEKKRISKVLATRRQIPVEAVRKEIARHDQETTETIPDSKAETFTEEETRAAEQLLKDSDILSKIIVQSAKAGYVGEEINQKMLYLSYTSRLTDKAISNEIKGVSASGKSTLVHMMQRFMPKQDVYQYSMITAKALVHCDFDLSHKILSVEERHGSEAADYSIRTIISEQEISILISVKDEKTNNYKATTKRIPATGMVYTETTTAERVHNENQTRVFDLFMDESVEMNKKVIKEMGRAAANPRDTEALEKDFRVWRCAQALLKPYKVRIPFADKLDEEFPISQTRVRRDFPRFLALIEAHCLIYQCQRDIDDNGYLVATLDDLKGILPLADIVLTQSLKEISPAKERLLTIIQKEFKSGEWFSIKDLQEKAVNYANYATLCQTPLAQLESNNDNELHQKKANYANMPRHLIKEKLPYRTLQRYVKGFVTDGLLEWNGERGTASKYSFSTIPDGIMAQSTIFTPNFLKSLGINYANRDWHNMAQLAQLESKDSDKADNTAHEGNGATNHEAPNGKDSTNGHAFNSCDDFIHPDGCNCGYCLVMNKEAEQIVETISREGEILYDHVWQKNGKVIRELVYPGDLDYARIAKKYKAMQRPKLNGLDEME